MELLSDWLPTMARWLTAAGVAPLVLMTAGVAVAAAKYPGYRHRAQVVSELGTAASPGARWFNAAWVVSGLLIGACAAGVWLLLGASAVVLGLALFALGTLLTGLFPCEPGCPPRPATASGRAHAVAGLMGSLGAVAAALAMGFWAADQAAAWTLTLSSLIVGGAGLALLFATLGAIGTGFEGLLQRAFLLGVLVWLAATAAWLVVRAA